MFVVHNGSALAMNESAMAELGMTNGQSITLSQLGECLAANARAFCRDMDARRANGEQDIPDTAKLAKMAGHTGTN